MSQQVCRVCGGDFVPARTRDDEPVPLEKWTEPSGPNRYRVLESTQPLLVEPVSERAAVDAYPDHRNECPGFRWA